MYLWHNIAQLIRAGLINLRRPAYDHNSETLSRPNSAPNLSAPLPRKPHMSESFFYVYDRYKNRGASESRRPTYALHWFPARFKIIRSLPAKRQNAPFTDHGPPFTLNRPILPWPHIAKEKKKIALLTSFNRRLYVFIPNLLRSFYERCVSVATEFISPSNGWKSERTKWNCTLSFDDHVTHSFMEHEALFNFMRGS